MALASALATSKIFGPILHNVHKHHEHAPIWLFKDDVSGAYRCWPVHPDHAGTSTWYITYWITYTWMEDAVLHRRKISYRYRLTGVPSGQLENHPLNEAAKSARI
ncbi:hypothetical protein JB92DRAFT_2824871 [Gautieria morchelliformis]|nr:hypothetical protein JB92DRAFT_2824871 [Gautieria morchelliformis]